MCDRYNYRYISQQEKNVVLKIYKSVSKIISGISMENKCIESEQIFFAKMNRYSFKLSDKKWQLDKENCVYPHKM